MFVPEKLKLNKFVLANIPSNKNLFARLGFLSAGTSGQYSGDDTLPLGQTKIDTFADMEELDRQRQREELEKE